MGDPEQEGIKKEWLTGRQGSWSPAAPAADVPVLWKFLALKSVYA